MGRTTLERCGEAVGIGEPRVRERERRIARDRRLERSNRRCHRAGLALSEIAPAPQIILVRVRIAALRWRDRDARLSGERSAERDGDRASDAILDVQHVAQLTGVLLGPERRVAADIHEPRRDADEISLPSDAALQDVADYQTLAHVRQTSVAAFEREGGCARRNAK